MSNANPYEKCPIFKTKSFLLRLVQLNDAEDLLSCYSDPLSQKFFNRDNCHHDFVCHTVNDVKSYINYWLEEYSGHRFIRFSVIDLKAQKAIGTIEMFTLGEKSVQYNTVGVLRIDLCSNYEKESYIREILQVATQNFFDAFGINHIIAKAVPEAKARISALTNSGFMKLPQSEIIPFGDYYIR